MYILGNKGKTNSGDSLLNSEGVQYGVPRINTEISRIQEARLAPMGIFSQKYKSMV